MAPKQVVCVGDSIRMGYESTVRAELAGRADVRGVASEHGYNTRNVLEHLDDWVLRRDPDVVHINVGLHDLIRDVGPGPATRVPLDEYRANLQRILSEALEQTEAEVILALTTPVDLQRQRASGKSSNRINDDVLAYNNAARQVAAELGLLLNDLYQVAVDNGTERMLGPDGVHFTDVGYTVLGKAVAAAISAVLDEEEDSGSIIPA